MAHEAEVRGLENSPRFRERIAFARVQILSQELIRQIEQDSAKVSDKDIEDYYRTHADLFERATLERIFVPIPKLKRTAAAKGEASSGAIVEQQKETAIAMSRVAEKLRTKAVGGDSFLSLQKEAYAAAGETDVPPNSSLGQLRSGDLPPAFVSVFTLKAGEVSPVLRDSAGYYIYKLDAKEVEPLATAAGKIRQSLANQRRDEAIQTIQGPISTEVNQAYFGTTEKSEDNKRSSPSGQR
jgi:parvulin-like peptidyl-prolyl isomerase